MIAQAKPDFPYVQPGGLEECLRCPVRLQESVKCCPGARTRSAAKGFWRARKAIYPRLKTGHPCGLCIRCKDRRWQLAGPTAVTQEYIR